MSSLQLPTLKEYCFNGIMNCYVALLDNGNRMMRCFGETCRGICVESIPDSTKTRGSPSREFGLFVGLKFRYGHHARHNAVCYAAIF